MTGNGGKHSNHSVLHLDAEFRRRILAITAESLVKQSGLVDSPKIRLLDNATTFASVANLVSVMGARGDLAAAGKNLQLTATTHLESDPAFGFDDLVKLSRKAGWDNVQFKRADMTNMPFARGAFNFVFTNLGMLFCPDDDAAVKEIYRTLCHDGVAGFASWKTIGKLRVTNSKDSDEADEVLSDPLSLFPASQWRDPQYVRAKLTKHGFTDIQLTEKLVVVADVAPSATQAVNASIVQNALAVMLHQDSEAGTFDDMAEVLMEELRNRDYEGTSIAYIITARKPASTMSPMSPSSPSPMTSPQLPLSPPLPSSPRV